MLTGRSYELQGGEIRVLSVVPDCKARSAVAVGGERVRSGVQWYVDGAHA